MSGGGGGSEGGGGEEGSREEGGGEEGGGEQRGGEQGGGLSQAVGEQPDPEASHRSLICLLIQSPRPVEAVVCVCV